MKKLTLLIGAGVGFVLGSRAGKGPYMQLEMKVRKIAGRPEVQEKIDQVKSAAQEQATSVAATVGEKLQGDGPRTAETIMGEAMK